MAYDVKLKDLQTFDTGAKRDTTKGKGRYDLISPIMLRRLADLYEAGGVQKGDRNWEKGFPMSRGMDSAQRHINQYREGLRDEDHLIQAIWNLACVVHFEEQIQRGLLSADLDDLPTYIKEVNEEERPAGKVVEYKE
jgi:hypothetical protein